MTSKRRHAPRSAIEAARRIALVLMLEGLFLAPGVHGTEATAGEPGTPGSVPEIFRSSDVCMACHNGLITPTGEDVSIGTSWLPSMMSNSARDPYWRAAVRRETLDFPDSKAAIENECSICHMPMARFEAHAAGERFQIFSTLQGPPAATPDPRITALALEGVSCTLCHQIRAEGLGEPESFVGGFEIDTRTPAGRRTIYGPYQVTEGHRTVMSSASRFEPEQAKHIQESELCASCHTLYTHSLGAGEGTRFPEQMPYLEWRHSDYGRAGSESARSCQSCHMQEVEGTTKISSVLGEPREGFSRHAFRGANVLMPRIFARYRDELGVPATEAALEAAWQRTVDHMQSSGGRLRIEGLEVTDEELRARIAIENLAGHKLPSAYPSRRAWLRLRVLDGARRPIFESGTLEPSGAIVGNDNDEDPAAFEPHYEEIDDPSEVQIWEGILFDSEGRVTTGLLTAVEYGKDNRLLPYGFDKQSASSDIAVHGAAARDGDFAGGGDRIVYRVGLGSTEGPYTVEAELWYQPIAYRWAKNLESYDAEEPRRFTRYYDELGEVSAVRLATASRTIE